MARTVRLAKAPEAALLDGAVALALSCGAVLHLDDAPQGAGAEVIAAAAQLSGGEPAAAAALRALARGGPVDVELAPPRAGQHALALREPGAVARAVTALSWPLALAGGRSEVVLRGPNHGGSAPGFHELSLAWAAQAARFGLRAALELRAAAFPADPPEQGEIALALEPLGALTPVQLSHRGLLRQVTLLAASGSGAHQESRRALEEGLRLLRLHGVNAEGDRVPLPPVRTPGPRRWSLTAVAEFEHGVASASAAPEGASLPGPGGAGEPEALGARVASAIDSFLSGRGALDAAAAERMLVPAILCAAGAGAGPAARCHFTTAEVTPAQLSLAALAHTLYPVRAAIDGAPGEPGVIAAAPSA